MKKLSLIALVCFCATAWAQSALEFKTPILLTSCGQSADGISMKILLQRDSLDFSYDLQATAEHLAGKGSLIIVVGGSSKGLGAAKISTDDELQRVTTLIAAARDKKIPILVAHLGGQARRGSLSDPFNKLGAENADHLIVVKGGNDDSFFSAISSEKEIPLEIVDKTNEVGARLQALYAQ